MLTLENPTTDEDEDIDRCEDCGEPVLTGLWTLADGWGDTKRCCWSCACEAGTYGWRTQ